ncbi:MAG: GntR family transcriptional regulator [Armatimonadota bacterium]|nr:GntR family transcriptional regulator [Armatimonadota bacterium]MDR7468736.1 GntR family transcriptional regulator [Armatimonadota bacterium]MDR7474819.1 GntR family transcriptional regulator [Armatimonadota bacterium]
MHAQGPANWGPPPRREPVGAAAYRLIREAVLKGQLAPGERLNELELARAWQISRTPIRDALRRLEAEGLVRAVPGKGVVVPRLGRADVDELYEMLEGLEGMAARRTAERASGAFLAHLNSLIKEYGVALRQNNVPRLSEIASEFHVTIARTALNGRLERAIETIRAQLASVERQALRQKGRATRSFRELAKLTAAIRTRDGGRAEAAMREHLASLRLDATAALPEGESGEPT